MNKKRRRALMSSQVKVKRTDNPITICPTCGYSEEPDYIDGEYVRHSFISFCTGCDAYTEHYHCETRDESGGDCDIQWCSVCGRILYCPNCGSDSLIFKYKKCQSGVHDMYYYECSNCDSIIGNDGEGTDHEACNEEGDEGDHPTPDIPDNPDDPNAPTPIWWCNDCGYESYDVYPSKINLAHHHPDGFVTCPSCNTRRTSAYVCPECGALICTDLECLNVLCTSSGEWLV